jgi:alkanesulfonate monooxygenase SsuD/methylene tetrahydromethanopterin reductase-like flavin-dependent oxidoreductase (luciferase family)
VQNPLPVWLGVGGTPQSFARAGALGLPLIVAIIGGEPRRFRPLIDLYVASLPQAKMMRAIDAIGARVLPALHQAETDT